MHAPVPPGPGCLQLGLADRCGSVTSSITDDMVVRTEFVKASLRKPAAFSQFGPFMLRGTVLR